MLYYGSQISIARNMFSVNWVTFFAGNYVWLVTASRFAKNKVRDEISYSYLFVNFVMKVNPGVFSSGPSLAKNL